MRRHDVLIAIFIAAAIIASEGRSVGMEGRTTGRSSVHAIDWPTVVPG